MGWIYGWSSSWLNISIQRVPVAGQRRHNIIIIIMWTGVKLLAEQLVEGGLDGEAKNGKCEQWKSTDSSLHY